VRQDGYLEVAGLRPGDQGRLLFPVLCKLERETVDGVCYETVWIGNQIVSISPRGTVSPLPFRVARGTRPANEAPA